MKDIERAILATLTDISGIGEARAYELYTHFDDPIELIDPPDSLIENFHYVDDTTYTEFDSFETKVDRRLNQFEQYQKEGITILGIEDEQYPESVRDGPAPVLLYVKGNLELLNKPIVGVSGSRETNDTGKEWIHSVSADIAKTGYVVLSGGAKGADTAAHQGALDSSGSTIVVLGTGVNVAYPPENESLFDRVVESDGLLLSMRPPEAEPTRHSFINRNELIAALSDGMVFVATDGEGGTVAQYEMAVTQNLPTFAPPSELGIQPSGGLSAMRESMNTVVVQTAAEITNSLQTNATTQSNLEEWKQ